MRTPAQQRQLGRDAVRKMILATERAKCPFDRLEERGWSTLVWRLTDSRPGITPVEVARRFANEPIGQTVGQIAQAISDAMAQQARQKCITPEVGATFIVEFNGHMDDGLGWQVTGHCRPDACDPADHKQKAGWHVRGMHGGTSVLRPPVLPNQAAFVLENIGGEHFPERGAFRGCGSHPGLLWAEAKDTTWRAVWDGSHVRMELLESNTRRVDYV